MHAGHVCSQLHYATHIHEPTPTDPTHGTRYTTHHTPHRRMFGERKGPWGITPRDRRSGWAVSKASCHLQQHKSNGTAGTYHITHDTRHTTPPIMFGKREGGKRYLFGGDRRSSAYLDSFATIFMFSMSVYDNVIIGTKDLSRMKNQGGHWVC